MRGTILEIRTPSAPRLRRRCCGTRLAAESVGLFGDRVHVVTRSAGGNGRARRDGLVDRGRGRRWSPPHRARRWRTCSCRCSAEDAGATASGTPQQC